MLIFPVIATGLLAQTMKGFSRLSGQGRFRLGRLGDFESFPNFHALLSGALCGQLAQDPGLGTPAFTLAAIITVIILYDNSGVKRAAGKQAETLNRILTLSKGEWRRLIVLGQSPLRSWLAAILGAGISLALEECCLALGLGT
ncbi:MAG: divergent PAP2 family protein [Candidatus Krumholzibacteria bacterium]|jgi:hypothetical protein|nr:divergent PAP2 family protein [Candidatus Krumholzibacteria bacterium]MDP6669166.1 divergent PAP2 family protein [Candidatus Krumholzibacteria bacterium]MDP6797408.1 divergent PAP2 family protein [Candidatus Krumholzibacteria bacterium]MDP7020866.1 divergent PAP2 family protein [Candidatus Krumholzibacteria bacterium]